MDYQVKWTGQTTNATPKEIFIPGGSRLTIASSTTLRVSGTAVAFDSTNGTTREWQFLCLIKNIAGTVSFVGQQTVTDLMGDAASASWALSITADDTNNALGVTVTGAAGVTVDWNVYADYDIIGSGAPVAPTIYPADYSIITLATIKDNLNIATANTDNDNFLQTWINNISLEMEGMNGVNNKIKSQTITGEILNGNGRSKIRPNYYPIVAIGGVGATDAQKLAAVQIRADIDSAWEDIEDDVNHIIVNNPDLYHQSQQNTSNIELYEQTFTEGFQNVKLTYQTGYSTIPSALTIVCIEKVMEVYQNSYKGGKRFGIRSFSKSEGGGNVSTSYIDFTERHRAMMKPYRRMI